MSKYKYNLKPDKPDDRDYLFCNLTIKAIEPKPIDLRSQFVPPFNQFNQGSCTSQSGTAYKMFMEGNKTLLSRQFLYNQERILDKTFPEDSGSSARTICKTLQQYGICNEKYLPYDEKNLGLIPSQEAYTDAKNHTISSYHRIQSIEEAKIALSNGHPILFALAVYESFENVGDDGKIPMPDTDNEKLMGYHETLLVGFDNVPKKCKITNIINNIIGKKEPTTKFILRNSWSDESSSNGGWGDHGYGYLTDDVLKKIVCDMWIILK